MYLLFIWPWVLQFGCGQIHFEGHFGSGGPWKSSHFWALKWHWAKRVLFCSPESQDFQGPPLPMALVMDLPLSKSLVQAPYKNQVHCFMHMHFSCNYVLRENRLRWDKNSGALSIIYLPRVLCLSVCDSVCVCVSQFVSERSAILLVLAIKLTKEMRRKAWRGRD